MDASARRLQAAPRTPCRHPPPHLHPSADRISKLLAEWDEPFVNGRNTSWRAQIAANLGDLDEAVRLLQQAMEEGWAVWIVPHQIPFFRPLRAYPPAAEFMRMGG